MSGPLTKVRIDRPTLSFRREVGSAYYKGFEGNEAKVSAGIDEFFFLTCNWSILEFTCMKAFPQYQVISLDSTSQSTQGETCCYVVWVKERNLYHWSTNRAGGAAALVKFHNLIAVKNLEIFTAVITTWQNMYQVVNRIYSCSFSLQDMKVCCSRTSTRKR